MVMAIVMPKMAPQYSTAMPTPGTRGGRENWLYQYINTRFYEVTEDTKIKVRVGYWRDRENKKHNYLRVIAGQSATLDKYTINSYSKLIYITISTFFKILHVFMELVCQCR